MEKTQAITQSKLLLVEGKDERNLFGALVNHLSLKDIQIIVAGGYTQFQTRLKAIATTPGWENVQSLGIVRDADNDAEAAFQSICSVLRNRGLPSPLKSAELFVANPSVSILIVPPHSATGMLEDVCLESVQDNPAISCVNGYFECLRNTMVRQSPHLAKASVRAFLASREMVEMSVFEHFQEQYPSLNNQYPRQTNPAFVHAFLASRYRPDLDLGVAAQKGYWNFDHDAFSSIRRFMETL